MSDYFDDILVPSIVGILGTDETIWYRAPGQQPCRICGVFTARSKDVTGFDHDGVAISDNRPTLFIHERDLLDRGIDCSQGDTITLGDVDYQVADPNTDGFGGLTIKLNKLVTPR